ncbi:prolyl oligopeptidase family serine peptidase [Natronospira bacteriovora]|uniref:Prolyl oligopeptidase family serine peptidase n=1 Tax=Natronospira bacteriovora TaxID=3069753 RepID=A0ABU0WA00_9GAMM|nr:prolyl oligopeptidase family serine peptidase [Natronospira sp. AB-CW4]MDQ2070864.1 prolyl oligopeptidase family serine peptidase [Natronospira sp. AB-CW4]
MTDMRKRLAAIALAGLMALPAMLVADDKITLERIMAHPDWLGNAPESWYWRENNREVIFQQKREGEDIRDVFRLDVDSGEIEQVKPRDMGRIGTPGGDLDRSQRRLAFARNGDVFVKALDSGKLRQLTRNAQGATDVRWLADDFRVTWRSGQSYFAYDLESGLVEQLADIRLEKDPLAEEERFDFLGDQQARLFTTLTRERDSETARQRHDRELARQDRSRHHRVHFLGDDIRTPVQSIAPSGDQMLLVIEPANHDGGRSGTMPAYVTESGYVEARDVRTRVGQNPPVGQKLWLLDLESGERRELDLSALPGIDQDPLADLRPQALEWHVAHGAPRYQVEQALKAPDQRDVRVMGIRWDRDNNRAAVMLRAVDNKDRWIAVVDPESGDMRSWHRLTDPAWINWAFNEFDWLPDGSGLWYLSEESGFAHLYVSQRPNRSRALTEGRFKVNNIQLSRDGEWFYLRANAPHPGIYEIFRVPVAGGELEQLTELGGQNDYRLSPRGDRLIVEHANAMTPPELYGVKVGEPASATRLTHTVSEAFLERDWIAPKFVEVPSSHVNDPIHTRLYLPPDFDPEQEYPAVFFVHGAGYLQNAHQGWSNYFREFMFHSLLAHEGYVVMDMDYRASAGYGRDWRTAIYRQMGHPELEDHVDGVHWVIENYSVDPDRIGIYGGSYGGFMTFMALFREPGMFAAGAALRPVSDWAHYNHPYTSNILNTPLLDPMAFEKSSPIEFAEGLEAPLLITSGMLDDNVFYQDVVRLTQRLLELEKEDFENAMYPLEPHGFVHPEAWLDQYRRIYKLFDQHVR